MLFGRFVCNIAILLKAVARFVLCNRAVFDCVGGTVSNARHAVGAGVTPNGFSVCYVYVVERAKFFTLFAPGAGVFDVKFLCSELKFTPNRIDGQSNKRFK